MSTVVALLLAGGVGARAAQDGPKQLAVLGDRTVLEHAVAVFVEHARVDQVIAIVPADLVEEAATLLPGVMVVRGGATRQQSASAGLAVIEDDDALVLIHDVARPFVPPVVIDRCLDMLATHDAVGTVVESADTLFRVETRADGAELVEVPDRRSMRRAQTPQGFRCDVIRDAHKRAVEVGDDLTDDCSVVLRHRPDISIALVPGDERNIKLTTAADFAGARRDLDDAR